LLNISNAIETNKAFNANKYHQEIAKCFDGILPAIWLRQPIGQRSGGEQQRIALALTLAHAAPLVFLDEPLTHLDEVQQIQTLQHLTASGKTLIMVSHHIRLSLAFATHVLLPVSAIGQGAWLAGTRDTVANIENLAAAYNINTHLAAQLLAGNVVS
jgi:ABC-type cobalamin/Fe3+-siderophores transport system ATPase subunit